MNLYTQENAKCHIQREEKWLRGWPTKMFLFFFGNNFYKNKEIFKIFSPQILEVYRILLVETTLESIMFYYTFSVINTMFVPCTALLYEQNSNNKIVHNSIEHFMCNPPDFFSDDVLSCQWIVFTNSVFQVPSQKIARRVEILGIGWPGVIGLTWIESVPREVIPEVFKCSVQGGGLKWGGVSFLEQNTWIP